MNREVKNLIKRKYLVYRREFIRAERKKSNGPNKRVTKQMLIVKMMDIVEESVREFNARHRENSFIRNTFVLAGHDPWKDCSVEFKANLDKISELPLYGGCKTSVEGLEIKMIKSHEGLLLERDVYIEGDAKEVGSDKGDVEVKEGGL